MASRLALAILLTASLSLQQFPGAGAEDHHSNQRTIQMSPADPSTGTTESTDPDPLDEGTALPPSTVVRPQRQAASPQTIRQADLIDLGKVAGGTVPLKLYVPAADQLPYGTASVCNPIAKDPNPHDQHGVRKYVVNGTTYDHPVGQAQLGINCLMSYQRTKQQWQLDIATANAHRLLDTAITGEKARGSAFYPYPFDFAISGLASKVLKAPWFSAMAQGQALTLFSRLWATTHEDQWRAAADLTAPSLALSPTTQRDRPYTTWVDKDGYLWLEEYAKWPADTGERVLNGHLFALFGLYDYIRIADSPQWRKAATAAGSAEPDLDRYRRLASAALATANHYIPTAFRQVGNITLYSLATRQRSPKYHSIHVGQLLTIHAFTRDPRWAEYADMLEADYPSDVSAGWIQFAAGTHTLYKIDTEGVILSTRTTMTLRAASAAPLTAHRRMIGLANGNLIGAGLYAGWWVPEIPGRSMPTTPVTGLAYGIPRAFSVLPGTYTAYKYGSRGEVLASRTVTFTSQSSAHYTQRSQRGVVHLSVSDGTWAGYSLPLTSGVIEIVPVRRFTVAPGSYTGVTFDLRGGVRTQRSVTFSKASSAAFAGQIMRGSQAFIYVTNGTWQGYWLPVGGGIAINWAG